MNLFPDDPWVLKASVKAAANTATEKRLAVIEGAPPKTRARTGEVCTPDARTVGWRERHILIQPDGDGRWEVNETDDEGGWISGGLTKVEALAIGVGYALHLGATLTLQHDRDG